jgi:hypothetical protein
MADFQDPVRRNSENIVLPRSEGLTCRRYYLFLMYESPRSSAALHKKTLGIGPGDAELPRVSLPGNSVNNGRRSGSLSYSCMSVLASGLVCSADRLVITTLEARKTPEFATLSLDPRLWNLGFRPRFWTSMAPATDLRAKVLFEFSVRGQVSQLLATTSMPGSK